MENQAAEQAKRKLETEATDANDTPTKKARVEESTTGESTVPGAATVETPAAAKPTEKKAPAKPAARKYVYREDDDESESDSLEYKDDEDDEDFAFGEEDDEDDDSVSEDRSESA